MIAGSDSISDFPVLDRSCEGSKADGNEFALSSIKLSIQYSSVDWRNRNEIV